MTSQEKKYNILKSLLDSYELEGVCGYTIMEDEDEEGVFSVYIIFDLDWLQTVPSYDPQSVIRKYKKGIKELISNFTGIQISYVGSSAKKCKEDTISESLSPRIRRRLQFHTLKSDLDYGVIDEMNPCQFLTPGQFITEACDMLKDIVIDYFWDIKFSPEDNDQLYYYFVDEFGEYLTEIYLRRCPKRRKGTYSINESTKADKVKKVMYKVLDSMSEDWTIKIFSYDEMIIFDSEGWQILNYDTIEGLDGKLFIDPLLLRTVVGYATVDGLEPDEYDIREWFNQKYGKHAKSVEIYDKDY